MVLSNSKSILLLDSVILLSKWCWKWPEKQLELFLKEKILDNIKKGIDSYQNLL